MQSKLEAKYLREIGEKVYSFFFENPEMENNKDKLFKKQLYETF